MSKYKSASRFGGNCLKAYRVCRNINKYSLSETFNLKINRLIENPFQ